MEQEISTNQTQFSQEEPLRESIAVPKSTTVNHSDTTSAVPKKKTLPILMVLVTVSVVVVAVLLILVSMPKQEVMQTSTPSPTPQTQLADDHPLQVRVTSLQTELDAADPTKQTLVFPPIDMTVTLDEIK